MNTDCRRASRRPCCRFQK